MANKILSQKERGASFVTVYCNLPSGVSFDLPDGRRLTFRGYPVSRLVDPDGHALPGGKYRKTPHVRLEDWEWIARTYAEAAYFDPNNPLLFATPDGVDGDAQAKDLASTRHGMEQIDVRNREAQTVPEARNGGD